jgi:phosphatidylethanolamine-binding protein (PEBP) family uncharacterized protein
VFQLSALGRGLGLERATTDGVERAMEGHVVAEGKLIGTYQRA